MLASRARIHGMRLVSCVFDKVPVTRRWRHSTNACTACTTILLALTGRVLLGVDNPENLATTVSRQQKLRDGMEPPLELALVPAVRRTWEGEPLAASAIVREALGRAQIQSTGWTVPVEPLLGTAGARDAWADVLTLLRTRAT